MLSYLVDTSLHTTTSSFLSSGFASQETSKTSGLTSTGKLKRKVTGLSAPCLVEAFEILRDETIDEVSNSDRPHSSLHVLVQSAPALLEEDQTHERQPISM
jgi:hypothetical protein